MTLKNEILSHYFDTCEPTKAETAAFWMGYKAAILESTENRADAEFESARATTLLKRAHTILVREGLAAHDLTHQIWDFIGDMNRKLRSAK